MITKLFISIELFLRLFKLWDRFMEHVDHTRALEAEARAQAREKALEDLKNAKTEEEIWRAQEELIKNQPRP